MKAAEVLAAAALALALPASAALAAPGTISRVHATTVTVATTDDAPHAAPLNGMCTSTRPGGACTLRAAIQAANFLGDGPHTINLRTPGTYTLTAVGPNEDEGATGDLDINGTTVAIANTSNGLVAIDGNHTDRVLSIGRRAPAHLTISGVTIQNGAVPGASIPPNSGGGLDIAAGSSATVTNSTFTGNKSAFAGGGIRNEGDATLSNVTISGNAAVIADGGIANNEGSTVRMTNVVISANSANINGGFATRGKATLTNVLIGGNLAFGLAGAGANANGATVTMTNVALIGNVSFFLIGGFGNLGNATLTNVTISGNSAMGDIGGMGNLGTATLTNVTIADNSGLGSVGGLATGGEALTVLRPLAPILAISGVVIPPPGPTTLSRTIVADNAPGAQCVGPITSLGSNLEFAGHTCGFKPALGDIVNKEPLLGPLTGNGGFVPTHELLPGSPAIDAVRSGCPPPSTDARGVPRPQGKRCDIGAYERGGAKLSARVQSVTVVPGQILVSLQVSRPTGAQLTLTRAGRRVAAARYPVQAGFNILRLPLPSRVRAGTYQLSIALGDRAHGTAVFTRSVRLRGRR